jgi:hypothetical protein
VGEGFGVSVGLFVIGKCVCRIDEVFNCVLG